MADAPKSKPKPIKTGPVLKRGSGGGKGSKKG